MKRRRHERTGLYADATISCGLQTITGEVENISLKGLFIRTPGRFPVGEQVKITLFFYGSTGRLSFAIPASVVRADSRGLGFSFERINIASLMLEAGAVATETKSEFFTFMERHPV